jgi:hypothetical protein
MIRCRNSIYITTTGIAISPIFVKIKCLLYTVIDNEAVYDSVDLIHRKLSIYSDEGPIFLHVYYNARTGLIPIYNELIFSIGLFIIVVRAYQSVLKTAPVHALL